MALQTTANLAVIVDPAVRARFNDRVLQVSNDLDYLGLGWREFNPNVPSAKLNGVSGVKPGTLTVEGQTYGANERYEGYALTVSMNKYSSDIQYTEELVHWLQKNDSAQIMEFTDMVDGAVNALNYNIDQDVAKIYYLGFGTTFFTGGDGYALFSASHTTKNPTYGTQRNLLPTADGNMPLGSTAVKKAITVLDRMADNAGVQLQPATDLQLVVPLELEADAHRTLYSDYGPDTANLGLNPVGQKITQNRMRNIKVKALKYIPSSYSTYWFLQDQKRAQMMALLSYAWKPRLNQETSYIRGTYYVEASTLFAPTPRDWKWVVGSKGDSSAT